MTHLPGETAKEKLTTTMPRQTGMNNPLNHAYKQAPWRNATQRGVLFFIAAILGGSILWIMVNVTIQAAAAGLEIQSLEEKREELERQIAGRRTDIARQTTAIVMKDRAEKLGFQSLNTWEVTFLVVPGYPGRESKIHVQASSPDTGEPIIKPVYTQSLSEWLIQSILDIGESPVQRLQPVEAIP